MTQTFWSYQLPTFAETLEGQSTPRNWENNNSKKSMWNMLCREDEIHENQI